MRKVVLMSLALLGSALASSYATAGVVRCNSCQPYQVEYAAAAAGPGSHIVYDPIGADLTFWRVTTDRETGGLDVMPVEVPTSTMDAYFFNLEVGYLPKDTANIGVTLTSRGWSAPNFGSTNITRLFNPISSFPNGSAYQVVNHATFRSQLASAIASALSGGNTGLPGFDAQMGTFMSTVRNGIIPETPAVTFTVTVVWGDGSKSVFEVLPNNMANLLPGRSEDPMGNPIPDWTMNTPEGTGRFSGEYLFGDQRQMNQFVNQLMMFGIPIVNTSSGRLKLSCVRVGSDGAWECKYI